jgi:hypothetical protein
MAFHKLIDKATQLSMIKYILLFVINLIAVCIGLIAAYLIDNTLIQVVIGVMCGIAAYDIYYLIIKHNEPH